ncbi:DsbA family protein [Chondromyces apiculatus]|uniref:DsbA family protein n=1 Tax=Chondromyces apiculatus TaxID=51 RepID=UPI0018CC6555|nr:thioredoxin domain-containing protein [Chondromyces apiculatus]
MNRSRSVCAVLLTSVLVGCGSTQSPQSPQFEGDPAALPGPSGAAPLPATESEPEELAGVNTGDLVRRERVLWWKLVNELYAPCSEQAVSIAQCVREARSCAACAPAAQLLADKIHGGAAPPDAQAAYAARFGPDVKQVAIGDSPSRGPENAPVVVVVWSDYECPACKRAMPFIEEAFATHPGQVRLVHKFYPLRAHVHAGPAARAAFAAQKQGKYWEMERMLFDNQLALNDTDLRRYAQELGLQMERFESDRQSDAAGVAIERDVQAGDKAGLQGTPHILINGRAFSYGLFSIDPDLGAWIDLEVKLAGERGASATSSGASPAGPGSAP